VEFCPVFLVANVEADIAPHLLSLFALRGIGQIHAALPLKLRLICHVSLTRFTLILLKSHHCERKLEIIVGVLVFLHESYAVLLSLSLTFFLNPAYKRIARIHNFKYLIATEEEQKPNQQD
jgi:hypothetical protein